MFAVLALMGTGCLLYTDPVNEAPTVKIVPPARQPTRSGTTLLSAVVQDDEDPPDQISAGLVWTQTPGPCGMPAGDPMTRVGRDFTVMPQLGEFCVRVVAQDSRGATRDDTLGMTISNNPPAPDLQATAARSPSGKVRLYAKVELTAAGSTDPDEDPLTFPKWSVTGPDLQPVPLVACEAAIVMTAKTDARRCFTAGQPGRYRAEVTADDGIASVASKPVQLEVDVDLPPCLKTTDPLVLQPLVLVPSGGKRTFEVLSVDDDGEPFPTPASALGPPIFVWSRADDGKAMVRLGGNNAPSLPVSEGLFDVVRPGDQLRVRVEVRDRLREEQLQQRLAQPPCPEEMDVCQVDGCLRWTTWKVQFFP
jgi:hypothetical protein